MGLLQPLNIFLRQEIDRIQRVLTTVRNILNDLKLAIDGTIIMNENLRDALDNMFDARIPNSWLKVRKFETKFLNSFHENPNILQENPNILQENPNILHEKLISHENLNILHSNLHILNENPNILHESFNISHEDLNILHSNLNVPNENPNILHKIARET